MIICCNIIYRVIYEDKNINKICDSYQELYEKIINLYVLDINNYNKKIDGYNNYKNENIDNYEMIHNFIFLILELNQLQQVFLVQINISIIMMMVFMKE